MIKWIVILIVMVEICTTKSSLPPDKSQIDEELIKILAPKILFAKKPINFLQPQQVSINCRRDFLHYSKALLKMELWALRMLDASGSLPSGILSGNVNSFGDFQECLSVLSDGGDKMKFRGKHCYVEMQPFVNKSAAPYIDHIRQYVQSFELIRSRLEDPGHIFSRFSSIVYGICVPSSCNRNDVEEYAKFIINEFIGNNTGLDVDVQVREKMCHVAGEEEADAKIINNGAKITIAVFAIIVVISLYASYQDEFFNDTETNTRVKDKSQWLEAFSLSKNYQKLISTKRNEEDIKAIHGIKFINAILIFICHKTAESMIPSINRTEVALVSAKPSSIIVRICALYTDVFLMLSGVLVGYSITNRLMMKQRVSVLREYITRYIRIIPNIIVTMLLTGFVLPLIVPKTTQKALIIDKPAELCRKHGWRNLFMIQNWFRFEEMCNLHSHHIATDFELFLLTPFLLMLLWRFPKKGFYAIASLGLASTVLRFYITYIKQLTYFVPFSVKLSTLIDTANHLYTLPTYRFTVYGVGLLIGYIMRKERNFKVNNLSLLLGNSLSGIALLIIHTSTTKMIGFDVEYDKWMHASFAAFAPILVCIPVAWIIFLSHNGHTNRLIKFLEWKGFLVTTKLCYAFYLIQIPIFQLLIANRRDVRYYNTSSVFDLNEIFVICMSSVLMTLFIEMPVLNLKKIVFSENKKSVNGHVTTENNNEFKTKSK